MRHNPQNSQLLEIQDIPLVKQFANVVQRSSVCPTGQRAVVVENLDSK